MYPADLIPKVVPHRFPFLMIDRIVEHEFQKQCTCLKNVTFGEEILSGHFPDRPVYPGVLLIEMGLQTTQVMLTDIEAIIQCPSAARKTEEGYVLSIEKFKFLRPVQPGDVLLIQSRYNQEALNIVQATITIRNQVVEEVAVGKVNVKGAS
ncbi:MAG: 3-hydroxyacyl-ACP dehydratase FabZ [Deltaproteobacteria bacterium]|nr:3-hydroxyacyl-ACP dehydratase FabZ [Deltaproteobacteria bacterium]